MPITIRANGPHFTDPREFIRSVVAVAKIAANDAAASTTTSNGSAFYTQIALRGASDDTNWTANTYKSILSIPSGSGLVSTVIGPTGLAGTPTTTFEFTVDGFPPIEVPVVATAITQRAVLGPAGPNATYNGPDGFDAGKTTSLETTDNITMLPWRTIGFYGIPCLIFRQSLLIRAKSSENNSTTTNQERRAAMQYVLRG